MHMHTCTLNFNFNLHLKFFNKYKNYFIIPKVNKNVKTNFLAYPIIIKENKKFNRKKLQVFLENNSIQTRPIFTGNILRHPAFKNLVNKQNKLNAFKNSDYIMKNGILIGCHQGLNLKDIKGKELDGCVIFGQVVGVHLNSNIINKDGKIDLKKINVVARLGYNEYTFVNNIFTLERPKNSGNPFGR